MLAFDEGASLASSFARATVAASHAILLRSSADRDVRFTPESGRIADIGRSGAFWA
jgi:hypothetical protein